MRSRKVIVPVACLMALAAFLAPRGGRAGDRFSQTTFGSNFFSSSPRCPVNQFPTFEAIAPVPSVFDFDANPDAIFTCLVDVQKNGKGVNRAKGTFETELIVRDNITGMLETFGIDSGKFKTDSNGQDAFDFEIPAAIFADGFESGDVSAWSYTRADFTNKKKATNASVQCGKSASKNN